jgi:hypothetical protein
MALAACSGGGGSTITVPPPTGGFTLASLKGTYAFSMSGMDTSTTNFGAYFARTGSFVADGAGNISSAVEDVVDLGSTVNQDTLTGKYNVLANGRGTIVLTDTSGNTLDLTMDLQSSSQGLLVETDGNFASSGSFNLQNVNDFLATSVNGTYVFDFPGVSLSGTNVTPISLIGTIAPNGSQIITGGVFDTNDANNGHIGPSTFSPGSYQLDPTYSATYGRGIASFGGATFAFYIVDSTHLKFIEEDPSELVGSSGDALLQSGTIPTTTAAFTGSFAYLVGGSSISTLGADASVGRFTVSGTGTIGTISYDENNNGTATHISQGSNITNATYAIDTTNAGSGRGTFTFTDTTGTYSYVFYLYSPTSGVIQDVSTNIIADGTLLGQSGSPFTLSGLAASYAYNWNGVNNSSGNEEDFIGLFTLGTGTTSNITGVLDGTVIGSSGGNSYPNIGTQGTLTIASDGTTNNTLQIVAGSPLGVTYDSVAYVVNANTVLILGTDSGQVLAGVATRQSD